MTEDSKATDLLGDPLRPLPDKRGRRKLRYPPEVYETVEVLAAGNLTHDEIADAIGISPPTLRKYFRRELDNGLARQKAEALRLMAEGARKGNAALIKAWNDELDKRLAEARLHTRAKPEPRKGKKEARQDAADAVAGEGGLYAPAPAPGLIN